MKRMWTPLLLLAMTACAESSMAGFRHGTVSGATVAARTYHATASDGERLTITVDPASQTMHYANADSGQGSVLSYTVNSGDGGYTLADPAANLDAAFEVPGAGIIVSATRLGPHHDSAALIAALDDSAAIARGTHVLTLAAGVGGIAVNGHGISQRAPWLTLPQSSNETFDPSVSATYRGLSYQKTNAVVTPSGESGSIIVAKTILAIDAAGNAQLKDRLGNTIFSGALTPVDGTAGLFTFRTSTGGGQQDVFVTFAPRAAIFWSFAGTVATRTGGSYSYLYGIALR